MTPFVKSFAEQSNSRRESTCDCSVGIVLINLSVFIARRDPSSFLLIHIKYNKTMVSKLERQVINIKLSMVSIIDS